MAILLQSTAYVRSFVMYLAGTKTPATGKTIVVNLSKAGAAFGAAAGAVAEIGSGWYKVSLSTADTNTVGDLAFNCTEGTCDPNAFTDQVGPVPANLTQIDGLATVTGAAILNLKQLAVINSTGSAIVASSTGSNGHGISASGNGSGSGIQGGAGATGHGIDAYGGATSGSGIYAHAVGSGNAITAQGTSNGSGIAATGSGTGLGIIGIGGATGHGINGVGGATSGSGFYANATGFGAGITAIGVGSVSLLATQGISGPLDATERDALATAALKLNLSGITGEAAYSLLNALRYLRNWSVSGSTLTVFKEDGTTPAWTSTLTTSGAASPVIGFDTN